MYIFSHQLNVRTLAAMSENLLGDSTFLQGSAYAQILQSEIVANNKDQINNTRYGGMGVDLKAASAMPIF